MGENLEDIARLEPAERSAVNLRDTTPAPKRGDTAPEEMYQGAKGSVSRPENEKESGLWKNDLRNSI